MLRNLRRASLVEKLEMLFLGIVHICFAVLIALMMGVVCFLIYVAIGGLIREVSALF